MEKLINIAAMLALISFVSTAKAQSVFDVTREGAKANGDISQVINYKSCATQRIYA